MCEKYLDTLQCAASFFQTTIIVVILVWLVAAFFFFIGQLAYTESLRNAVMKTLNKFTFGLVKWEDD